MDGSDQEQQKHACRVCNRSFPSGRSLGGHMRSHISTNSPSEVAEKKKQPPPPAKHSQSSEGLLGIGTGYGVREKPKKTWRAHQSNGVSVCTEQEKLCRQCGKGFPSWRALFGHMRCHSPRPSPTLGRHQEQEEPAVEQTEEEEEVEEEGGGGSWDSATVSVALCLMMLSRNVGFCNPSDEDSALLEEMEGIAELGKRRDNAQEGDWRVEKKSLSRKRKMSALDDESGREPTMPPHKKNKFHCRSCGKAFHSHQALGGHRAGHKRRWRHFVVGSDSGGFHCRHHRTADLHQRQQQQQLLPPPPGALDLNLPAVADEDFAKAGGQAGVNPWLVRSSCRRQPLVRL